MVVLDGENLAFSPKSARPKGIQRHDPQGQQEQHAQEQGWRNDQGGDAATGLHLLRCGFNFIPHLGDQLALLFAHRLVEDRALEEGVNLIEFHQTDHILIHQG